ncbi:NAD-dependent epimerase/dehydratase family protein [Streptomyces sp. NPDC044984]|uniref:NAD-dependent epimerase/dehydratase family protein n=1 Tax=Streptomyces sp. NPDC044984 TaxID=3154335 RepID=UPI0033DA9354
MDVFLTGASGYIGGAVARRLTREGHTVRGLTRTPGVVDALAAAGTAGLGPGRLSFTRTIRLARRQVTTQAAFSS